MLTPKTKGVKLPAPIPLEQQEAVLLRRLESRRAAGIDVISVQLQLVSLYQIWAGSGNYAAAYNKGKAVIQELLALHRQGPAAARVVAAAADWYRQHGLYALSDPFFREMTAAQRKTVEASPTRTSYLALATTLVAHAEALEVRTRRRYTRVLTLSSARARARCSSSHQMSRTR